MESSASPTRMASSSTKRTRIASLGLSAIWYKENDPHFGFLLISNIYYILAKHVSGRKRAKGEVSHNFP